MSNLLPVLYEHTPRMMLCQLCPDPGHCCRDFSLWLWGSRPTFWKETWERDAQQYLAAAGLPFTALRIEKEYLTTDKLPDVYVTLRYGCPMLTEEGRCSIYLLRPNLCRHYAPGEDEICVFGSKVDVPPPAPAPRKTFGRLLGERLVQIRTMDGSAANGEAQGWIGLGSRSGIAAAANEEDLSHA